MISNSGQGCGSVKSGVGNEWLTIENLYKQNG